MRTNLNWFDIIFHFSLQYLAFFNFFFIDAQGWVGVRLFVMLPFCGIFFYWRSLVLWDDLYDNIMCCIFLLALANLLIFFFFFLDQLKHHLLNSSVHWENHLIFDSWKPLDADWILKMHTLQTRQFIIEMLTFSLFKFITWLQDYKKHPCKNVHNKKHEIFSVLANNPSLKKCIHGAE